MPLLTADHLDASIRGGKIGSIYIFDGPETWLKSRAVQRIINTLLPKDARDFNLERFDANSCAGGQVVSSAASLPFLSDRRVVVLDSAEELNTADSKVIAEALPHIPQTTCLLFLYQGKADLRNQIPAQVISAGSIVTFWPPFPNQLPRWIMGEVKLRERTMTYEAAQTLGESCADLQEISNELDKLILFIEKKSTITLEDVVAHGLPDESGDQKDLERAIFKRDVKEALKQGRLLSEMGVRAEMIFPTFERIFRNLILAQYNQQMGHDEADVFSRLKIRGKTQQENFSSGMSSYRKEELTKVLEKIIEAEYGLKTGAFPSDITLTLLILGILGEPSQKLTFSQTGNPSGKS